METNWKDIQGFENNYQINILGDIRNKKTNQILKPYNNTKNYKQIVLWKDGKGYKKLVHKLVAETFILDKTNFKSMPNEDRSKIDLDKLEINHKDENKANNCVYNLEWCTSKYNSNYGTRNLRLSNSVICIELNKKYNSIQEASKELNIQQAHISGCCAKRKHYKTAGGYHWEYAKELLICL